MVDGVDGLRDTLSEYDGVVALVLEDGVGDGGGLAGKGLSIGRGGFSGRSSLVSGVRGPGNLPKPVDGGLIPPTGPLVPCPPERRPMLSTSPFTGRK